MLTASYDPLTYAVRNAPIVLESEKDNTKEVVHIGADLTDNYTYTALITDVYGSATVTENFPGQDFYNAERFLLSGAMHGRCDQGAVPRPRR